MSFGFSPVLFIGSQMVYMHACMVTDLTQVASSVGLFIA